MREFKLTESKQKPLTTYTVVVDDTHFNARDFSLQDVVYKGKIENGASFMNVYFTVDEDGKVVDVSVQVND